MTTETYALLVIAVIAFAFAILFLLGPPPPNDFGPGGDSAE